jgi:hypothetical protein
MDIMRRYKKECEECEECERPNCALYTCSARPERAQPDRGVVNGDPGAATRY